MASSFPSTWCLIAWWYGDHSNSADPIPAWPMRWTGKFFFYVVYKLCRSCGKVTNLPCTSPYPSASHAMKTAGSSVEGEQCFCSSVSEVSYLWCIPCSRYRMGDQEFVGRVSAQNSFHSWLVDSLQIRGQEWVMSPAGRRGKLFSVTFADMPYILIGP